MSAWVNGKWTGDIPTVKQLGGRECNCCRAKNIHVEVYPYEPFSTSYEYAEKSGQAPYHLLCHLCAGTMTSKYAAWYKDESEIMKTICFVGNQILKELKT